MSIQIKDYEEVTDVAVLLSKKRIQDFCNTFLNVVLEMKKTNKSNGFTPIVKNWDYGFYNVDYGFVVFVLEKYVKMLYKFRLDDEEKGIEVAAKIHEDFAVDYNEELTKNGRFLMALLAYHNIYFHSVKEKNLYSRVLYKNNKFKNFIILNSVNFNMDKLVEIAKRNNFYDQLDNKNPKLIEQVSFGKGIKNSLKTISDIAEIYQFWDRQKGFNSDLLK